MSLEAIRSHESDERLLDYYQSKGWSLEMLEMVNWGRMNTFLIQNSPTARCKILQSMHIWQNMGYQKRQFDCQSNGLDMNTSLPTNKALWCGQTETPFHYMYCHSDEMCILRDAELASFVKELRNLKTAPSLREAILEGIYCVLHETEYDLHEKSNPLLCTAAHTRLLE
jgi:hypothetical protein